MFNCGSYVVGIRDVDAYELESFGNFGRPEVGLELGAAVDEVWTAPLRGEVPEEDLVTAVLEESACRK